MTIVSTNIEKAAEILKNNDLVAVPTETVYGLAGNIFSEEAIKKIFETKQRPLFNPLIVHLHSVEQLEDVVDYIPEKAKLLANAFWPGPLTLVLPKKSTIPSSITAGKDTVAVRIPNHSVMLSLLKLLPFPIAAPSANPFNRISPTSAQHVAAYFNNSIKMVLDGGECKKGIESTIIGFKKDTPILYRLGAIAKEDIEALVGPIKTNNNKEQKPNAPGMLAKHYAPLTKTYLVEDVEAFINNFEAKNLGVITFSKVIQSANIQHLEVLSPSNNLEEAASNLYKALHTLDNLQLEAIVVEKLPEKGLGVSINDRLKRATT